MTHESDRNKPLPQHKLDARKRVPPEGHASACPGSLPIEFTHHSALAPGHCTDDEERLGPIRDRVGQGSVGRFVGNIFATTEEPNEWAAPFVACSRTVPRSTG